MSVRLSAPLAAFAGLPEDEALAHLAEALTHPSFANEQRPPCPDYQRLEFLGDAVLGVLVSEELMRRLPSAREGELSLLRANVVSTDALAAFAKEVEIGPLLRLGKGADAAGERAQASVLADAVEAVVGALYLDRGLDVARPLAVAIVEAGLARRERPTERDPKSELQEKVQARGGAAPRYRLVSHEGPDHARAFVVEVDGLGRVLGEGRGRSKKGAEQAAARAALERLADLASEPVPG